MVRPVQRLRRCTDSDLSIQIIADVCNAPDQSNTNDSNIYRENLEQLVLGASLVFQERMEHQGRRQI